MNVASILGSQLGYFVASTTHRHWYSKRNAILLFERNLPRGNSGGSIKNGAMTTFFMSLSLTQADMKEEWNTVTYPHKNSICSNNLQGEKEKSNTFELPESSITHEIVPSGKMELDYTTHQLNRM